MKDKSKRASAVIKMNRMLVNNSFFVTKKSKKGFDQKNLIK